MKKKSYLFLSFIMMFFMMLFVSPIKTNTSHAETPFESENITYAQTLTITDDASLISALNSLSSSDENNYYLLNFNLTLSNEMTALEDNSIVLSNGFFTISGSITSNLNSPVIKITTTSDSDIIFSDLTINGDFENLIEVESNTSSNLLIRNCNFTNNSSNDETYSIKFDKITSSNFAIEGNIQSSADYLYNHVNGLTTTIESEIISTNELYFSFPYNLVNQIAINNYNLASNKIIPKSTNETIYNIDSFTNGSSLIVSSNVLINFDDNNSDENNITLTNFEYTSSMVEFPSSTEINKSHYNFGGWFGKIVLNATTYYFDQSCLENYIQTNDLSSFETNLSNLSETSFESYSFDENDITYKAVNLFLSNNQVPTFIAKWNDVLYTINFNTNGGSEVQSITNIFGTPISNLPNTEKQGFNFGGWFTEPELENEFNQTTMPDEDITLYAKWLTNSYKISFVTNTEQQIEDSNLNFGDSITLPSNLTKTGYTFDDWYIDFEFNTKFNQTTMPDENITLYAKWKINEYTLKFIVDGKTYYEIKLEYNEDISNVANSLTNPQKVGYTFKFWYSLSNSNISYNFVTMPAENLSVYARFQINSYTINFITNSTTTINPVTYNYNTKFTLPTLTKDGSRFTGWFTDSACTTTLQSFVMPDRNLTLYAGWSSKLIISINKDPQTYTINTIGCEFGNFSELSGFNVQYLVDGEWSRYTPTKIGTYDVLVTRAEDENYSAFAEVIHGGLTVEYEMIDLTWLFILLFVIAGVEIFAIILLRVMRKMKSNLALNIAFIPLLSMFLDTKKEIFTINSTQAISITTFVLIIISAVLALIGFVGVIYGIVKLHRVAPAIIYQNTENDLSRDNLELPKSSEAIQKVHNESIDKADEDIKSKVDQYLHGISVDENTQRMQNSDEDFNIYKNKIKDTVEIVDDFNDVNFNDNYESNDNDYN